MDSAGDEAARFVAWLSRTQPVLVRTATVISRVWTQQPGSRENEEFAQWLQAESEACSRAARSALLDAGVPSSMLDAEVPSAVSTDHSETSVLILSLIHISEPTRPAA